MTGKPVWMGSSPKTCDKCKSEIKTVFADCPVPGYGGTWGIVCGPCALFNPPYIGQLYKLVQSGDSLPDDGNLHFDGDWEKQFSFQEVEKREALLILSRLVEEEKEEEKEEDSWQPSPNAENPEQIL